MLDISFQGDEENSLKNRTWGDTPQLVIDRTKAFNNAMRAEGILSCGKHFPGYSRAQIDPHHELPTIERSRAELESWEWKPFAALKNDLVKLATATKGNNPKAAAEAVSRSKKGPLLQQV